MAREAPARLVAPGDALAMAAMRCRAGACDGSRRGGLRWLAWPRPAEPMPRRAVTAARRSATRCLAAPHDAACGRDAPDHGRPRGAMAAAPSHARADTLRQGRPGLDWGASPRPVLPGQDGHAR